MRYLIVLVASALYLTIASADEPLPNIVLMMADDMGLGDTSAYQDFTGNSDREQIHTPAMNRLANRGIRFTDAHTPSSRCSPTRYGLLTGRYPWRNRLKFWVLFGSQGDPMIEADRPTLATLLRDRGYRTAMVGKWHVGLRYHRSDQQPAAGWQDADLRQPLADGPAYHGFDESDFTSRSHGTSGPAVDGNRPNTPDQDVGPGHIRNNQVLAATDQGKQLAVDGPDAYILKDLGGRHLDRALRFLKRQTQSDQASQQPFFLYYACNANHTPHTPDEAIAGTPVAGHARSVAGEPVDKRGDYIYENDVALSKLVEFLQEHEDPRCPGQPLIENTIVLFTSDNGAEKDSEIATGPFRSNKGSVFEGGHRVPLIVSWPTGGVGDGNPESSGVTNGSLVGLVDLFATFAEITQPKEPESAAADDTADQTGRFGKGGEDSRSILAAWRGRPLPGRPMFFNDHKQADDPAVVAMRMDDPTVDGEPWVGQWKIFFDAGLLRRGTARPILLFNLLEDREEHDDRLKDPSLDPLVKYLTAVAIEHRSAGGHNLAGRGSSNRITLSWNRDLPQQTLNHQDVRKNFEDADGSEIVVALDSLNEPLEVTVEAGTKDVEKDAGQRRAFDLNPRGLGIASGRFGQVDAGEAIIIRFNRDVLLESVSIVAGNGVCGGFYQLADQSPQQIYCVDDDIDSRDQSGILSDLGPLRAGQTLRLDSSPFLGVENPGQWRLGDITFRIVD